MSDIEMDDSSSHMPSESDYNSSRYNRSSSIPRTSPPLDTEIEDLINNLEGEYYPGDTRERNKDSQSGNYFNENLVFENAAEDLQKLKQVWISERTAPDLQQYEEHLVERMNMRIREQVSLYFHSDVSFFFCSNILLTRWSL